MKHLRVFETFKKEDYYVNSKLSDKKKAPFWKRLLRSK